jgi:excisionase family DNA binding protein
MSTTKLISIAQFARLTGLDYFLARKLVIRGDVPSVAVGKRRRIDAMWVEKWMAKKGLNSESAGRALAKLAAAGGL